MTRLGWQDRWAGGLLMLVECGCALLLATAFWYGFEQRINRLKVRFAPKMPALVAMQPDKGQAAATPAEMVQSLT